MPAIKTSCREIGQIIESKGQLAAIRPKSYLICYRIKSLIVSFHRYYQFITTVRLFNHLVYARCEKSGLAVGCGYDYNLNGERTFSLCGQCFLSLRVDGLRFNHRLRGQVLLKLFQMFVCDREPTCFYDHTGKRRRGSSRQRA